MKSQSENLLSEMPVRQAIMKIGIPAITAMLVMAVYNLVDTLFIGMLNDDYALAAVAVAFPIMALMGAVGQVFGAGAAVVIGRAFGAQKEESAHQTATTIIATSFIAGFIFMLVGIIFIEPIFRLFGTTEAVMDYAVEYGIWMYIGAMFSIPNQSFNNIARAEAKAVLSMKALMIGAISNVILDPIFMFDLNGFGLNMGLEGASMATTLAQAIGFVFIASYFFRGKMRVKIKKKYLKISKKIYSDVLTSGLPIGVSQFLSTIAVSVTNIVAVAVADTETAAENMQSAYGIVLKIAMMALYVIMGYLQGYQPIASVAYGAKNKERFYESFRYISKALFIIAAVSTVLIQVFATPAIAAFTSTPEIIEMGAFLLRTTNIFLILLVFIYLIMFTFQATGKGGKGGIIALARQGYLYLPVLLILGNTMGLEGIFYAQPIADLGTALIAFALWRKMKVELEHYFGDSGSVTE